MKSILHIVTGIDVGGVSTLLLNYYTHMDRTRVHFDIVAIDIGREQLFESSFKNLGVNIYYMPKNYGKRFLYLFRLLRRKRYDIVHSHIELPSAIYLLIAKLTGVKNRFAHAHMAFMDYHTLIQMLLRWVLNKVSTKRFGCSEDAIRGLFGSNCIDGIILYNAINISCFSYKQEIREEYRKTLGVEDNYVMGFVGRFTKHKNIFFMLDIFCEFYKHHHDALLLIAGDGEEKKLFFDKVEQQRLSKNILYLKERKDVNNLMMAMDVLLLPSRSEGLGIVLIEAQTAALKCITCKETVPYKETNISQYIHYCSISASPSKWAEEIEKNCMDYKRMSIDNTIRSAHYDIRLEAEILTNIYCNCK